MLACFLFLTLLSAQFLSAQNSPQLINNATAAVGDINGAIVPTFNAIGVEGNRYLQEEWNNGTVWFANGKQADSMQLIFDLVANAVYFQRKGEVQAFVDEVKSFRFYPSVKNKEVLFKSGYPDYAQQTPKTFYEILADGAAIQLLKFHRKKITETYVYNSPSTKKYTAEQAIFVYDSKNAELNKISLNKKSIEKALPDYANTIESLCQKNRWNLKSEEEMIKLILELNKKQR